MNSMLCEPGTWAELQARMCGGGCGSASMFGPELVWDGSGGYGQMVCTPGATLLLVAGMWASKVLCAAPSQKDATCACGPCVHKSHHSGFVQHKNVSSSAASAGGPTVSCTPSIITSLVPTLIPCCSPQARERGRAATAVPDPGGQRST